MPARPANQWSKPATVTAVCTGDLDPSIAASTEEFERKEFETSLVW